nr:hypothetical protein [Pseudopedobacter sp.]
MHIAYITYENMGKYNSSVEDEDHILLNFLKNKGLKITEEKWSSSKIDWSVYEYAIIKTTWDYIDKFEEWTSWLNKIEQLNIKLLNPVAVVKWNSDKHYLHDIEKAGLMITPTQYCEKYSKPQLTNFFEIFRKNELVIKPTISGGSKNTFRFRVENVVEIQEQIHELLEQEAYMVQPYLEEITTEGEWSFLFFNGVYSHSLIKKAKPGDFRVQHYLGGTIHPQNPTEKQIVIAHQYVDQFAKGCLYARVDGVMVNGKFNLMELELIDPFLFLFTNPHAYENYFQALKLLLNKN